MWLRGRVGQSSVPFCIDGQDEEESVVVELEALHLLFVEPEHFSSFFLLPI